MNTKIWLFCVLVFAQFSMIAQNQLIEIAYVKLGPLNPEENAAIAFLKRQGNLRIQQMNLADLGTNPKLLLAVDAIWIHGSDSTLNPTALLSSSQIAAVLSAVNQGKGLLLSNYAASLLNTLNLEETLITTRPKQATDNGYGRMLGFHAYRNHPIFKGLNGGAYILKPTRNITVHQLGFFDHVVPSGKVVATDWDYIFLREQSKLIMEYNHGKGKVVAVGGYMLFNEPNVNAKHLEIFTLNCLHYLTNDSLFINSPTFYWNYTPETVKILTKRPLVDLTKISPSPFDFPKHAGLQIYNDSASNNFWDLAGERLLVMGKERGGIDEVWAHPFMAFRDVQTHIQLKANSRPVVLDSLWPSIQVTPEALVRTYKFDHCELTERVFVSPTKPSMVLNYTYQGPEAIQLTIQYATILRLMWPYSENVPNAIACVSDALTGVTQISDDSGDFNLLSGAVVVPKFYDIGQYQHFIYSDSSQVFQGIPTHSKRVSVVQTYILQPGQSLNFIMAAAQQPISGLLDEFMKAAKNPLDIYNQNVARSLGFFDSKLQLISPDNEFNQAFQWALRGTDAFYVHTPEIGSGLVAGYSTTATGWDGEHKVSGRPGYAWYFGRDAEWSALAMLGYGDFAKVKEVIRTLNRFQDLNGKIFHELSTSGFAHYDASDATPLYLVLVGRYLQHTGDTTFIKQIWPNINNALQFCLSTDTDADHLIENTNVGHGWVEGGYLFGSHTSLYLASCWAAALKASQVLAKTCQQPTISQTCAMEYERVVEVINHQFWNPTTQYYFHGMFKDGSFHQEPSVMPSIPLLFKQADSALARKVLPILASNEYSTNWGCRIVSENSPAFKPTGYHTGSVWPLFTGWVALAEFAYQRPESGYSHLLNNLLVYKNWGLGFVEEVLNGKVYEPSGVCRHQCWSETMSIQPAIDGMLGFQPDALSSSVTLAPSLPANWDSLTVNNLRCGQTCFKVKMLKKEGVMYYDFQLVSGPSIKLRFKPYFECFSQITSVGSTLGSLPFTIKKIDPYQQLDVEFELSGKERLRIDYKRGIQVIPFKYDPKPGSSPEGMRIVETGIEDGLYYVDIQGLAGSEGEISFSVPANVKLAVKQAELLQRNKNELRCKVHFEATISKYVVQRVYIKP